MTPSSYNTLLLVRKTGGKPVRFRLLAVVLAAASTISLAARAQTDPSTKRPDFREPPVVYPGLLGNAPVTLRAIYDDQQFFSFKKRLDGSREIVTGTKITPSFNRLEVGETYRVSQNQSWYVTMINDLTFSGNDVINTRPRVIGRNDTQAVKDFIIASRNTTNLHTHGLHVSPRGLSDNVLLRIDPTKQAPYRFDIPPNHAPGTHWYHPHHHGSTGLQVTQGMLGALIIDGPRDQDLTPPVYQGRVKERILVLQQQNGPINPRDPGADVEPALRALFSPQPAAQPADQQADQLAPEIQRLIGLETEQQFQDYIDELIGQGRLEQLVAMLSNLKQDPLFTVNGLLQPVDEILPGDIVRLRIINGGANNGDYKQLYVEDHQMYLAAMDGINLTHLPKDAEGGYVAYDIDNKLQLAPSNRADVYFIAGEVGTHALVTVGETTKGRASSRPQELMTFEVSRADYLNQRTEAGEGNTPQLAAFLEALDRNLKRLQNTGAYRDKQYLHQFDLSEPPDAEREIVFNVTPQGPGRIFSINGHDYNQIVQGQMAGKSNYLGKNPGDGGTSPTGVSPWPIREGTVEQWKIMNPSSGQHPFHIHVNPFWVVDIDDGSGSLRARNPNDPRLNRWQDTVNLPARQSPTGPIPSVTIRHRFQDFSGLFVLHCHILNHEDRGMMINVLIMPKQTTLTPAQFFQVMLKENEALNEVINK